MSDGAAACRRIESERGRKEKDSASKDGWEIDKELAN